MCKGSWQMLRRMNLAMVQQHEFSCFFHPYQLKCNLLEFFFTPSYNHPQKLWHKPPSPSFNVGFLRFGPTRCTRQSSEQFQTILTLSQN